ncbi:DUF4123 domain-containing protein [Marinobacter oulmenensis]|uniref:DUF4123 domain-containing protein n=1 Tax=Marinobacter oulmenensis TaxID=643747 RepID=A0A840UBT0_9GAMM|nr:DUF4123 domain-containing protein [Marinobacter oulmenensis]MBB5322579.1 hypothetical protein [Marinobacter oulmenensis]
MQLIDQYPPDWEAQTISSIKHWLGSGDDANVYLLVDAAFRYNTALAMVRSLFNNTQWLSLYQDAPNTSERVLAVSPLLLRITEDKLQTVQQLRKETEGNPMLSMIVSKESMEGLWQRLAAFRFITIQKERYLLRLSDNRRLPQVMAMLTPAQKAHLTGGMLNWSYVARDGLWYTLDLGPHTETPTPPLPGSLELNEHQVSTLLDMNRIDALADGLRRNEPAIFQSFDKPSELYGWIEETLDKTALPVDTYAQQLECCRQAAYRPGHHHET